MLVIISNLGVQHPNQFVFCSSCPNKSHYYRQPIAVLQLPTHKVHFFSFYQSSDCTNWNDTGAVWFAKKLFFPLFHSLVAEKSHEHDENGLVREKKKEREREN